MTSSRWEGAGGVAGSESLCRVNRVAIAGAICFQHPPYQDTSSVALLDSTTYNICHSCSVVPALALQVIAENHNVCNQLHMPAQSGASTILQRMRRGYTREAYDALVQHARDVIPGVALSTDIITGESESSHT